MLDVYDLLTMYITVFIAVFITVFLVSYWIITRRIAKERKTLETQRKTLETHGGKTVLFMTVHLKPEDAFTQSLAYFQTAHLQIVRIQRSEAILAEPRLKGQHIAHYALSVRQDDANRSGLTIRRAGPFKGYSPDSDPILNGLKATFYSSAPISAPNN